ncbi:MAG: hypothetical protein AB7S69_16245 [Salinivirgaceae bacterium]
MTAISALISKDWIAAASDSLLTEFDPNSNQIKHIEFKKSKIVPIRKFKAAAAYWGLAKVGQWRTYDFLKAIAADADKYNSFEDFAVNMRNKLRAKIDGIKFNNPIHRGIGIHLIGYENINNKQIPELFLICNYTDPTYTKVGDLSISRNLYKTLPDEFKKNGISLDEQRNQIVEFLDSGRLFIFNNGDPALFNPSANTIHAMFKTALDRKVMNKDYNNYMRLASRPIEMIKKVQNDFFEKDYVRVGGQIHHLLITERGDFLSDTGDNEF